MHIQDFFQNFLKLFLARLHSDCTINLIAQDMSPSASAVLWARRGVVCWSCFAGGGWPLPFHTRLVRTRQVQSRWSLPPPSIRLGWLATRWTMLSAMDKFQCTPFDDCSHVTVHPLEKSFPNGLNPT